MLVLSRKLGETILIPGLGAEIAIVAIRGTRVQLGISAPANVVVRRQEAEELTVHGCRVDNRSY